MKGLLACALCLVVTACATADSSETTGHTVVSTTTVTSDAASTTVTPGPGSSTTTTSGLPIEIVIRDGEVIGGPVTIEAVVGATVVMVVTSDVADHVHVHGFDHFFDIAGGVPTEIVFVAVAPGMYEVELEDSHTLIAELVVR